MDAVLDIGNSRVKWGVISENQWLAIETARHEDLLLVLERLQKEFSVTRLMYANVSQLKAVELFQRFGSIQSLEFKHTLHSPINLNYLTPRTLGKDRLLGIIQSFELFPEENALVIDAGTCITYDLRIGKHYEGGRISPGLQMRLKAMNHFTGKLPLLHIHELPTQQGVDTDTSIKAGAFWGMVAEIEGNIAWYIKEYGPLKVIATGGDWSLFAGALKNSIFADPNLILKGLKTSLKYN